MKGALVILLVLLAVGIALYLHDMGTRRNRSGTPDGPGLPDAPAPDAAAEDVAEDGGVCCGRHAVCGKTSLSPLDDTAEYYDDEELDRYRGRSADSYTDAETEEFRDILMTMRADEVAGWSRSLQVRGITPPGEIRDEILLIVGEVRGNS